ncbi:hypothetical protein AUJ17_05210 [Candidatus Micrarchaeota archaeon CG1_02_47_40]|nr:MAG: hypothetical protein AUJ17_05210 [Candidatus Micrarchaeota archaeon CG1_02_47_40]
MKREFVFIFLLLAVFLLGCAGNGKSGPESGKSKVVATIFPLYEFAREIGGENANVSLLLPPGADAHSYEPKPSDIAKIGGADIFIYAGDALEPWAGGVLAGAGNKDVIVIDASRTANASADPHFWLDFERDKKVADAIAKAFAGKDEKNAGYYEENAQRYSRVLDALDWEYSSSLANCNKSTMLLSGHNAFSYLANNYGFEIVSTSGFSPEGEPTPKRMGELFRRGREEGIKYVFYEPLEGGGDARAAAQEIGGNILPLNPAASIISGEYEEETFILIMEKNLVNLKEGLECEMK